MTTMCDSKDQLLAYLYGELDGPGQRAFDAHLQDCAECRAELAGLRATRGVLASWAPPEPDLGLRIVRGASAPPRRTWALPAWGLAAAAALVLAASAAIANLEIRYGSEGLVVRTGWARAAAPVQASAADAVPASADAPDWRADLARFEQRLREIEGRRAAAPAETVPAASNQTGLSDAELLRRVAALVEQSETRQQRELAYSIRQVMLDLESRRQADLASIRQGLGQIQGATDLEIARNRQALDYFMRVAQQGQR